MPKRIYSITLETDFVDEEYTDKSRIGKRFRGWGMASLLIHQYRHRGDPDMDDLETAFTFYRELLSPRIIQAWGPTDMRDTKEQDISDLGPGKFTEVLLYASAATFQWYYFASETELRHLEVVVGYQLVLVERIFKKDLPVIIPTEEDMGWPIYPGAEFLPLASSYMEASEDFPGRHYMSFQTKDPLIKVKSWFETELSMLAQGFDYGEGAYFRRIIPGMDFIFWPMISIQTETIAPNDGKGQTVVNTLIKYEY